MIGVVSHNNAARKDMLQLSVECPVLIAVMLHHVCLKQPRCALSSHVSLAWQGIACISIACYLVKIPC